MELRQYYVKKLTVVCFVLFLFCISRSPRSNRVYHRLLQTKKPLKQLRKHLLNKNKISYIANEAKISNKSRFDYSQTPRLTRTMLILSGIIVLIHNLTCSKTFILKPFELSLVLSGEQVIKNFTTSRDFVL